MGSTSTNVGSLATFVLLVRQEFAFEGKLRYSMTQGGKSMEIAYLGNNEIVGKFRLG